MLTSLGVLAFSKLKFLLIEGIKVILLSSSSLYLIVKFFLRSSFLYFSLCNLLKTLSFGVGDYARLGEEGRYTAGNYLA